MLIPADIEHKQFSTTRIKEGYVQEEVDDFLDRVQEDYKFLHTQVERLEAENGQLRKVQARASEAPTASFMPTVQPDRPSAIAEKMLAAAEVAAKQHEAEARSDADKIVREAGGEAARLVEEAVAAAERIKSEGLAEKIRRSNELDSQIVASQHRLADVKSVGEQTRKALAEALTAYDREASQ